MKIPYRKAYSMINKKLKWLFVIAWMVLIFWFSSMPASVSDEKSHFVIYVFNLLGLNLNGMFGDLANFIVRKCAHFSEYFIFYLFLYNAYRDNFSKKKALILSLASVFLYACTDEFHQLFVPGREARLRDVLIDTAGGTLSMVVCYFVGTHKKRSAL
jgi:VanZ family protein